MACIDDDIYVQPKNQPKILKFQPKILVLGKYKKFIYFYTETLMKKVVSQSSKMSEKIR